MIPAAAKRLRILASILSLLALIAVIAVAWLYRQIRASLPRLDGSQSVAGFGATVTIERDAQGVPTIRGANRVDVARALGWLHGQDRFFQMDLMRRSPAGELAEMFGSPAVPHDRAMRLHGFRRIARQVVASLPADQRTVLEAYTAGVNAGLAALGARPFEYLVLRETPRPWLAEDSILVIHAMMVDLQDESGGYEQTLMTLQDKMGPAGLAFFAPLQTPADAALDGSTAPLAPIPGPGILDLRNQKVNAAAAPARAEREAWKVERDDDVVLGSNAFALAGSRTAGGAGLLANDMHLNHGVPNTWYRVSFEYAGHKVTGVALPGTPAIAAGSNGGVAWGLTDAYADTGDLIVVEPSGSAAYRVPGAEPEAIERREEIIRVKGSREVRASHGWTRWGPVVGASSAGKPLAYRWVAHDPAAINLALLEMETAPDVRAAIGVAHRAGVPAVNIVLADRHGAIAWTIAGRLPKRVGYDGRLPVAWNHGDRHWDGFLRENEIPTVVLDPQGNTGSAVGGVSAFARPTEGALWSANQRMIGGAALARIGDGGYPRPNRAAQIRDRIAQLEKATPRDLLTVQLDDRALFLTRWHELLMQTLTPAVTGGNNARAALRSLAEKWEGRASTESVSFRLVREFRSAVHAQVFPAIFASCLVAFPDFQWRDLHLEGACWTLVREKPPHLLNPRFLTWDDLLVAAVDDVIASLDRQGIPLAQANWGRRNTARIRHPFSGSSSWLSRWLDMPRDPLPGDSDMPRVQGPNHGASERLVVAPGQEEEGIFHMPGGQSGHPLSPFYRAGHAAWVRGEPTPFLPGKTEHTLMLTPR